MSYIQVMDPVRELILRRLLELRLSLAQASELIGRNSAYLQQFTKRGIPSVLREDDRKRLSEVLQVNEDLLRAANKAVHQQTTANNNHTRYPNRSHGSVSAGVQNFLDSVRPNGLTSTDLPVFGSRETPHGTFIRSKTPVNRTGRPATLAHVVDAYAVVMIGDLMSPAVPQGATVKTNPHQPCKADDLCVVAKEKNSDGDFEFLIRQFVRSTDKAFVVRQFNPKREGELKRSEWTECHKVVALELP